MRSLVRDYRYLLQNLLPLSRLFPERRHQINRILASGSDEDVRRGALIALEDLVKSSYLLREEPVVEGGRVSVAYRKASGKYRFLLHVPLSEWKSIYKSEMREVPDTALPPVIPEEPAMTIEFFPELIKSFSISEKNGSILQKLNSLAIGLYEWLHLPSLTILLVQEKIGEESASADLVLTFPESSFLKSIAYNQIKSNEGAAVFLINASSCMDEHESKDFGLKACAPVFALGEFWGIIAVDYGDLPVEENSKAKILAASEIISKMIENNLRLENLIFIDKLTGLYNRHFYDTQMPIEIERATRAGNKLSMLLLDLDDFKLINDRHGHRKGDEALSLVADLIKSNLRKIDLPFRYGGEEFVILLPGTAQIEAIHTAERLRSVISEYSDFKDNSGNALSITVSIGIAVFPDEAANGEELFIRADRAMFKAKELGKNRVELYRS